MPSVVATAVMSVVRVAIATCAVGIVWIVLSLPLGLVLTPFVATSGTAVAMMLGVSAVVPFATAGYISAIYITPGSVAHAAAAGFLATFLWSLVGSTGPWYFGIYFCIASAGLAAAGAWLARRRRRRPPNNWVERSRER